MKYITVQEASLKWNVSIRRIQQMCKDRQIQGAIKESGKWMIPDIELSNTLFNGNKKKKPLPIGISDYKKATSDYYYVDKTLLIRDFLDNKPQVSLYTRPRRFGKTLNMDMVRVFFEKTNEDTSKYFRDKKKLDLWHYIYITSREISCNLFNF